MFLILMFLMGTAFGSFLCCQARRLHLKDKKRPIKNKRSVCLECKKRLKWYDNIPVISWVMLRGRCRFCHKKIGVAELLAEILVGLGFLFISTTINVETAVMLEWARLITTLLLSLALFFLAIYDGIYGELPVLYLTISIVCAIITLIPQMWTGFLIEPLLAGLLYGGVYLLLYIVSRGRWVGDGDWVLAAAIGLVLGSPWLSLVALFLANLSACIVMLPFLKKLKNHQIYFGPFLIFSFVIVYTLSASLMGLIARF